MSALRPIPGRLAPILAAVARRGAERRARLPLAELERGVTPDPARRARFLAALGAPGLSIVAEHKRRSPAAGGLAGAGPQGAARLVAYGRGGAAALSILTEEDHFGGALGDLAEAAAAGLPRLRKDFLLDEGMVLESLPAGADAVLLIVAALADPVLARLRRLAGELGLAVLVEVHDEPELARALEVEPDVLGVNARDLDTFAVDLAQVERLLPRVPPGLLRLAESGIENSADLLRVRAAGADGALVGSALMRATDPERLLATWREALDGR